MKNQLDVLPDVIESELAIQGAIVYRPFHKKLVVRQLHDKNV